jgi:hypothetical protein
MNSARVNLKRITVNGNAFGIAADGTGSTAGINMTIADSMVGGNAQDGIIAVTPSGGAPIGVLVTNSESVNNAIGIRSIGPNVTVRVKNSDIAGNGTGLSLSSGGALLTFGNNAVRAITAVTSRFLELSSCSKRAKEKCGKLPSLCIVARKRAFLIWP